MPDSAFVYKEIRTHPGNPGSIVLGEAAAIGERLRHAVSAQPFDTPTGPLRVTISIGVAQAEQGESALADLMDRADRAMYAAKLAGRDRVATEPQIPAPGLVR